MSAELMGKDLTITNGDLQFSNNQDFSITSGYENLKQAIFDRLQTIKGEYYNEFYGSELDKCYSLPINQTLKNQIIGYVVEALNQEPRIKSKEVSVEFLQEGNVNYAIINMKIVPIDTNISLNWIYPLFV